MDNRKATRCGWSFLWLVTVWYGVKPSVNAYRRCHLPLQGRQIGFKISGSLAKSDFRGAVWAPHPTLPTNRAGGYYPPLRSIGYKNALVGAAICRPPCPPDCFFQICLRQIWSSLSLVRVQFKKTKRTEHIRQYTILVGLQGCATCYETVHRTVSSKFVFAKFGAACRWFESINSERKADTQKRIGFSLAPQVGLEPTTLRLTAACSTN